DENGVYIGEEYSLALCAAFIMGRKQGCTAVTNLSTSRMIDDIAGKCGGEDVRTPVRSEEYSLALCAAFIMGRKQGCTAVTNLSTSRMIDDIAGKCGGKVVRTPV